MLQNAMTLRNYISNLSYNSYNCITCNQSQTCPMLAKILTTAPSFSRIPPSRFSCQSKVMCALCSQLREELFCSCESYYTTSQREGILDNAV